MRLEIIELAHFALNAAPRRRFESNPIIAAQLEIDHGETVRADEWSNRLMGG